MVESRVDGASGSPKLFLSHREVTRWERGARQDTLSLVPTLGIFQVRTHLLPQLSRTLVGRRVPWHPQGPMGVRLWDFEGQVDL